ncbi:hypothetical protein ACTXT7_005547 [Hymenolepis weldensis]
MHREPILLSSPNLTSKVPASGCQRIALSDCLIEDDMVENTNTLDKYNNKDMHTMCIAWGKLITVINKVN